MCSNLSLAPGAVVSPVTAAVRALREAVDALAGLGAEGLADAAPGELVEVAEALHAAADTVRAVATSVTAAVDELDLVRELGYPSTARWLQARAGLSGGASAGTVALGRDLASLPGTRDAWLAGEVPEASVREIGRALPRVLRGLDGPAREVEQRRCEQVLLHVARTRTPADVRRAARALRVLADPEGAEAAQAAADAEQYLQLTPQADGVEVAGWLSVEGAAALLTALDRVVDSYHRSGTMAAEHRAALESTQRARRRATRAHLHARALVDLVGIALGEGRLGHRHDVRPHVTYTVHAERLQVGGGGEVLLPGHGRVPLPTASIDRVLCDVDVHPVLTSPDDRPARGRVRAAGGAGRSGAPPGPLAPLPPLLAEAFAAPVAPVLPTDLLDDDEVESLARRLMGEPVHHVLDVGRSFRTAPPDLRRALEVRDGGCAFPDCPVDVSRCEAHHVRHWRHGGETSLRNLVLLCLAHHHAVHEGGWSISARPVAAPGAPQRWEFTAPEPRLLMAG